MEQEGNNQRNKHNHKKIHEIKNPLFPSLLPPISCKILFLFYIG